MWLYRSIAREQLSEEKHAAAMTFILRIRDICWRALAARLTSPLICVCIVYDLIGSVYPSRLLYLKKRY